MDKDATKTGSAAQAIVDLIVELDAQRNTAGGIILTSHQTDRLLEVLKSFLLVLQQQTVLIDKLAQIRK